MALTRKQLWVATYAALCAIALWLILFPPKRKPHSVSELQVPAAQLGSGSGCEARELPKSLDDTPPPSLDPLAPKDETPQMKQARERITACMLHRLWPSASLQFGWDEKGLGDFDLVFPNNAYRRVSTTTLSRLSSDKTSVTIGAFLWLPHAQEFDMPPFVIARADAEGRVNYFNAFTVDADARISEARLPEWEMREGDVFAFSYEGVYSGGVRIAWVGVVDGAAAELVQRTPQQITLAKAQWTLAQESSDGTSVLLRAEHEAETRNIRVRCERSSGANCIVGASELVSEMAFVSK